MVSAAVPVLVVDDDPELCEVLRCALSAHGFAVEVAHDGREALRLLQRGPVRPAAVLLDLSMPEMDGEDFLRHSPELLEGIPIIVLTAEPARAAALSGFVSAVLAKPAALAPLVAVIRRAVRMATRPRAA